MISFGETWIWSEGILQQTLACRHDKWFFSTTDWHFFRFHVYRKIFILHCTAHLRTFWFEVLQFRLYNGVWFRIHSDPRSSYNFGCLFLGKRSPDTRFQVKKLVNDPWKLVNWFVLSKMSTRYHFTGLAQGSCTEDAAFQFSCLFN